MKISFNPGTICDIDGRPLAGRVSFRVNGSLQLVTIYTLEEGEFVESANPILLDNSGRLPDSVFFECAVVDVLVEKYVGAPGFIQTASDSDFEEFDRFQAGFDFDVAGEAADTVDTIAELKNLSASSNKLVKVCGYYQRGDAPVRYYIFDAAVSDSDDGGFVIASSKTTTGRWVLIWREDSVPASVYGVIAGVNESNFSNFLYNKAIIQGTNAYTISQVKYVPRGNYTTQTQLYCPNELVVDSMASFACEIVAARFRTSGDRYDNYNGIADVVFPVNSGYDNNKANMWWYKSAKGFWKSHAHTLVLDQYKGSNNVIDEAITISNTKIDIHLPSSWSFTFSGSGKLKFKHCDFEIMPYSRLFTPGESEHCEFEDCNFSDKLIGGSVDFSKCKVNKFELKDARYTYNWLNWKHQQAVEGDSDEANFEGHELEFSNNTGNFSNSALSVIRNAVASGTMTTSHDLLLDNVRGSFTVIASGNVSIALVNCENVTVIGGSSNATITATGCNIVNGTIDSSRTAFAMDGGTFVGSVVNNIGLDTKGKVLSFKNVDLTTASIGINSGEFVNCKIANHILVAPYKVSDVFTFNVKFVGNEFVSTSSTNGAIEFCDTFGDEDYRGVKNAVADEVIITNNVFRTTEGARGVIMPYKPTGSGETGTFLNSTPTGTWIYKNNFGNCPSESLPAIAVTNGMTEESGEWKYNNVGGTRVWNIDPSVGYAFSRGLIFASGGETYYTNVYLFHGAVLGVENDMFLAHIAVKSSEYESGKTIFNLRNIQE